MLFAGWSQSSIRNGNSKREKNSPETYFHLHVRMSKNADFLAIIVTRIRFQTIQRPRKLKYVHENTIGTPRVGGGSSGGEDAEAADKPGEGSNGDRSHADGEFEALPLDIG